MRIRKVFAHNLQRYRKMARISQEALAERAGLHRTYIGGIEQQRVNVSLKNIGKIADALNIDPSLLFEPDDGHDTKKSHPSELEHSEKPDVAPAHDNRVSATTYPSAVNNALHVWEDDDIAIEPLEIADNDLTLHVLSNLIMDGYRGIDLQKRYREIRDEMMGLLQNRPDDCKGMQL